ncbi:MAG: hypothetical protein HQ522_09190 [Bacteroidetes bacterium]|nr:hypothetical protein [Bacteroidota bacterium]
MKLDVEHKLGKIADIWNYFIWDYKFCSSKIKFDDDVKTNYFGDILGYFQDSFDIIFETKQTTNYTDKFSFSISFLQAIYIQQDFVEEILGIFKTGIDKGILKKDSSYSINRELRNELVGHPIRKFRGKLVSSTLFSYESNKDEIQYLRYHIDNKFEFENKTFLISEIQIRHKEFLEKYFDIILIKLKSILEEYLTELEKLENVIKNRNFKTVLKLVELYFEAIFENDYIYDKDSLIKIYERKEEHKRYENFIDRFYNDLKSAITEKKRFVTEIYERRKIDHSNAEKIPIPDIKFVLTDSKNNKSVKKPIKETFHYELGKIATKRNPMDFEFFGGLLKKKCKDNQLVVNELNHMENNIWNEIEYYTSLRLICTELNEE